MLPARSLSFGQKMETLINYKIIKDQSDSKTFFKKYISEDAQAAASELAAAKRDLAWESTRRDIKIKLGCFAIGLIAMKMTMLFMQAFNVSGAVNSALCASMLLIGIPLSLNICTKAGIYYKNQSVEKTKLEKALLIALDAVEIVELRKEIYENDSFDLHFNQTCTAEFHTRIAKSLKTNTSIALIELPRCYVNIETRSLYEAYEISLISTLNHEISSKSFFLQQINALSHSCALPKKLIKKIVNFLHLTNLKISMAALGEIQKHLS